MKSFLRIVLSIIPFIYMALIWYMSSNPDDLILDLPSSATDRFIKEALHLIEFAILYVLFVVALAANHKLTAAASLTAAIIAGLYGIIDELHQSFVPARSATLIDAIKDIVGVLAVYFHIQYHYFKHQRGFLTVIERILPKKLRDA
ncbi:VanZ family protein [Peribacillus psychrosaccharolyticus]|uniref:VanZ family protein n=1 Tax=Peribacillus psychrosaccharolyticus TaxID=1407 RepID=A0A974NJN6_PERPY|nr:VanZ family protein [Peribacillus psychrosaccharolyticus]MEC2055399.1 VanZ family protein [Peribacillus psychrosaccharolyticus]MED3746624.1 VanZ family protein [Peribacillus psychrosaccharolyticus]QQS99086.1 VanZ family protein [Peribacillus psychrosaccharolyticus]